MRNRCRVLHKNVGTQGRWHTLHCIPENSLLSEMLGFDLLAQIWTLCAETKQNTLWGTWHTKTCCFCWLGWCYLKLNHLAFLSPSPFSYCYHLSEEAACWVWNWFMLSQKRKCTAVHREKTPKSSLKVMVDFWLSITSLSWVLLKTNVTIFLDIRHRHRTLLKNSAVWLYLDEYLPLKPAGISFINITEDQGHWGKAILRNNPVNL